MRPIATYSLLWLVHLCVGLCVTFISDAEPIEMPFGRLTQVYPGNHIFHGGPDPLMGMDNFCMLSASLIIDKNGELLLRCMQKRLNHLRCCLGS